jgi:tRNA A-37 threonylcarbamoyl transferase component Bud32
MSNETRLADLLALWEECRRQGRAVTPAELCGDCPELLEELLRQLAALQKSPSEPSALTPAATSLLNTPPACQEAESAEPAAPLPMPLPVFPGYELLAELGHGGMGVVYKARDLKRDTVVALKTMQRADAGSLYRFKREFRALADVTDPHLVALYDLRADGQVWFFTMEWVQGVSFLAYVRRGATDWDRLRQALRQLAEGVTALHQAGKLHRDIKPSNVLVTGAGRVVLLDFGLAADLDPAGLHQSTEQHIVGTFAYMAPEQAAAEAVSPASDWYSIGVMLYEALTGRLPFVGPPLVTLRQKQEVDPPPPRVLAADLPADLNDLCVDLLRRDPSARPSGAEILQRLAGEPSRRPVLPTPAAPFVGREEPLAALTEAFAAVRQGQAVTLAIQGQSGVGKSTLVHRFLEQPGVAGEAVVLAGRCHERESVPYKALDSLVDALSRYLRRLPTTEVEALLPRDVAPLVRVFPVLRQVEAVTLSPQRPVEIPDPQELRRRAFAALRELLARLGHRRPLILFIDDLQWGDLDSAVLLTDLVRPPDPPVLLLVAAFRSEDVARSPCLRTLRAALDAIPGLDRRRRTLEPLTTEEVGRLTRLLLGSDDHAEVIARESGGSPFFVYELVQHLQAHSGTEAAIPAAAVTLDQVLWARVQRLPPEARQLLEVIAVADRPVAPGVACRAAGLSGQERTMPAALRAGRLIRFIGLTDQEEVETYHDRVRETVVAHLTPDVLREHHRRLAGAFEATGPTDPEVLAVHWHGATEFDRAGRYYAQAADQAAEALAFDRAAKLYRLALQLRPLEGNEARQVRTKLGDALANAGRGAEAAQEYLETARGADARESLELQRRAGEQFLRAGHLEEGLTVLTAVLKEIGMKVPATPMRALLSLLFRRALLWVRGIGFKERAVTQIPPEETTRADVCWSAALGLSLVDPIIASDFQVRHLLLALRSGDPYRIALGLAIEVGYSAVAGGRSRARTEKLAQTVSELANRIKHPHALGLATVWKGAAAWCIGDWNTCRQLGEVAEGILRDRCTGVAFELTSAQIFTLAALCWLGELKELSLRLPALLADAQKRGDLYTLTTLPLLTYSHNTRLAADQPDAARLDLRKAIEGWSHRGYHLQHFWELYGQVETFLYCGQVRPAWEALGRQTSSVKHSMLLRVQTIFLFWLHLRGRSALALAADLKAAPANHAEIPALVGTVHKSIRKMHGENMTWANALADLLRAGMASVLGDTPQAVSCLREAVSGLETVSMRLYGAAARRRLGELLPGDEGRSLIAQADTWMTGQGIVNPVRMTAMLAPGFPERGRVPENGPENGEP